MNRKTIVRALADPRTVAIRPTKNHFNAHMPRSIEAIEGSTTP